jgi:tRNA/rRNA methyltransferase/tRNA (cytidine32/uridine32-2'-O)-methyltransferase
MKNMGLSRLRLVAPPAGWDEELIRARAVHAGDIWEAAEVFGSLSAAVADCTLVIGTTRRRGRKRKGTLDAAEAAAFLRDRPGRAALVFGNERTGLDGEEMALCSLGSHIPVSREFPSLNLSHAVQIYAYELYRRLGNSGAGAEEVKGQWIPLERPGIEVLVGEITGSLKSLGFYKQPGREEQERFLRDVFSRAALTEREARYLGDIFAKAARLAERFNRPE